MTDELKTRADDLARALRDGRESVMAEVSKGEETIAVALSELTAQIQGMAAKLSGKTTVN